MSQIDKPFVLYGCKSRKLLGVNSEVSEKTHNRKSVKSEA